MRKIEDRSAHLLHLSVKEIAQCPDVGKLNLNSIVVSAVFAALDASENARDDAALKSPATASLAAASAATDSLAAGIYASDYDIASATYSTTPFPQMASMPARSRNWTLMQQAFWTRNTGSSALVRAGLI